MRPEHDRRPGLDLHLPGVNVDVGH
jgi:hypothetical protein